MVDMVLDPEKGRTFNCESCDYNLQINRNCQNQYKSTIIKLNDNIYKQCPRSLLLNCREEKYLVDMYFDCKHNKIYPFPGSSFQQTAFTQDLFDFIDGIVNNYQIKKLAEQKAQQAKSNKTAESLKTRK